MSPQGGAMLSTSSQVSSGNSQRTQHHESVHAGQDMQVAHDTAGNGQEDVQHDGSGQNGQATQVANGTPSNGQYDAQNDEIGQYGPDTQVAQNEQAGQADARTVRGSQPGQDREEEVYFASWGNVSTLR